MSDHAELKRLAEAIESCTSISAQDEVAWMRRATGKAVLDLIDEVGELMTEREELRKDSKDAERYRWLIRNAEEIYFSGTNLDLAPFHTGHEKIKKIKEGADFDIDAAMQKGSQP